MRLLVTGGATAGHIYPSIAIAKRVRVAIPDCEVLFVGSAYGPELKIVKKEGIRFEAIHVRGFHGKSIKQKIGAFFLLFRAIWESYKIIRMFKPDLVIGTGGYVCIPMIWVAYLMGKETLLHEQNAVPSQTTSKLARFASKVLISYKESIPYFKDPNKLYYTGNPVREEFSRANRADSRRDLEIPEDAFVVFITGGSNGAKAINDCALSLARHVEQKSDVYIFLLTGKRYYQETLAQVKTMPKNKRFAIKDYSQHMVSMMAASDLAICRPGAMSIAEMAAVGLPGILIPSPYVENNHQYVNARTIEKYGAGVLLEENMSMTEDIIAIFEDLYSHRSKLASMSSAFSELCRENALNTIMSIIYPYHLR